MKVLRSVDAEAKPRYSADTVPRCDRVAGPRSLNRGGPVPIDPRSHLDHGKNPASAERFLDEVLSREARVGGFAAGDESDGMKSPPDPHDRQ